MIQTLEDKTSFISHSILSVSGISGLTLYLVK